MISTKNNREYKPLTSDNILALVGEQEILRHYLGFDFDLKTCYLSTLRDNDLAPSLNFYYNKAGRLCYKDFGHSQGNVFDFVKIKYDITYKEVLEKINSDMGLGLGVSKTFNRPVRYLEFNRDFKKENSLLQFKPVKYGEKELEWWSSYGITSLDTLKHFKIFNTEMQNVMYYSDMPENPDFPLTDEVKKMVLHTFLNINGTTVMFSDCPPNIPLKFGNNTALVINKDNTEEIKELFNALKEGGTIVMDLQETFWSKLYAFVQDKYGILWHLIYTGN